MPYSDLQTSCGLRRGRALTRRTRSQLTICCGKTDLQNDWISCPSQIGFMFLKYASAKFGPLDQASRETMLGISLLLRAAEIGILYIGVC